jgi:hypothetical protein
MDIPGLIKETEGFLERGNLKKAKACFKELGEGLRADPNLPEPVLKKIVELLQLAQAMQLIGMERALRSSNSQKWLKEVKARAKTVDLSRLG